jgi:hypothetical protein
VIATRLMTTIQVVDRSARMLRSGCERLDERNTSDHFCTIDLISDYVPTGYAHCPVAAEAGTENRARLASGIALLFHHLSSSVIIVCFVRCSSPADGKKINHLYIVSCDCSSGSNRFVFQGNSHVSSRASSLYKCAFVQQN